VTALAHVRLPDGRHLDVPINLEDTSGADVISSLDISLPDIDRAVLSGEVVDDPASGFVVRSPYLSTWLAGNSRLGMWGSYWTGGTTPLCGFARAIAADQRPSLAWQIAEEVKARSAAVAVGRLDNTVEDALPRESYGQVPMTASADGAAETSFQGTTDAQGC